MERLCRECGAPLTGRSDKVFCCDDCRTAWHNRRYYAQRRPLLAVNRILRRNRNILKEVRMAGIRSISLHDTRMTGYDLRYFTSMERAPLGRTVYHCYEYSFMIRFGRLYLRQIS